MNSALFAKLAARSAAAPLRPFKRLFNLVIDPRTLALSYKRVRAGHGSNTPGADGITCEQIERTGVDGFLGKLHRQLKNRRYQPRPLLEVTIKQGTKCRQLSIPTIADRVVLTAMMLVLGAVFDPHLAPACYAYRPGYGVVHLVRNVLAATQLGFELTVVRADISNFFPSVAHAPLLANIQERITDSRFLGLLEIVLRAEVKTAAGLVPCDGLPQGSPLSPLLANVYLTPVHRAFDEVGDAVLFCYADDLIVLVAGPRERAEEVLRDLRRRLEALGLRLSEHKTSISTFDEGVTFVGFDLKRRGERVEVRPARSSMERFRARLALHGPRLLPPWRAHYAPIVAPAVLDECEKDLLAHLASLVPSTVPPAPPSDSPAQPPRPFSDQGKVERPERVEGWDGAGDRLAPSQEGHLLSTVPEQGMDEGENQKGFLQQARGPVPCGAGLRAASNSAAPSALCEIATTEESMATTKTTKRTGADPLKTKVPRAAPEISSPSPVQQAVEQALEQLGLHGPVRPLQLQGGVAVARIPSAELAAAYTEQLGQFTYASAQVPVLRARHNELITERKRLEAVIKAKLRAEGSSVSISSEEALWSSDDYQRCVHLEQVVLALLQRVETTVRIYEKQVDACSRLITLRGQDLEEERLSRR